MQWCVSTYTHAHKLDSASLSYLEHAGRGQLNACVTPLHQRRPSAGRRQRVRAEPQARREARTTVGDLQAAELGLALAVKVHSTATAAVIERAAALAREACATNKEDENGLP